MPFTIAISGKGGTGKTTIAGLIVRYLIERRGQAVLAVDADPNATLGIALGVEPEQSLAQIREDVSGSRSQLPAGVSKERHFQYMIQTCVVEHGKFDLVAMGRPEGPGCYCYVNHLLRRFLDELGGDYPFVLIDNEAGMEHLSRRTTDKVDMLLVVTEPTVVGLRSVRRILDMADALPILVHRKEVVLNKQVDGQEIVPEVVDAMESAGIRPAVRLPYDNEIGRTSAAGKTVFDIPADNRVYDTLSNAMEGFIGS